MSKTSTLNKLEERENKRRQSVVKSLISNSEEMETSEKAELQRGRPVKKKQEKKERKSLAILPSVYEDAAKIAYVDRVSLSEVVSNLLVAYIKKNQDKLLEYEQLKKSKK